MNALTRNDSWRKNLISNNFPAVISASNNSYTVVFGLALTVIGEGFTDSNQSYMRCRIIWVYCFEFLKCVNVNLSGVLVTLQSVCVLLS